MRGSGQMVTKSRCCQDAVCNVSYMIACQTPQQLSAPKYIEKLLVWAASLAAPNSKVSLIQLPHVSRFPATLHFWFITHSLLDVRTFLRKVESQLADEQTPQLSQRTCAFQVACGRLLPAGCWQLTKGGTVQAWGVSLLRTPNPLSSHRPNN